VLKPDTVAFIQTKESYHQVQGCSVVYMKGSKSNLNASFLDRKYTGRTVGPYLEMARTVMPIPDLIPITPTPRQEEGKKFPFPYHSFDENKKKMQLTDRAACNRMGQVISCDLGPLKHVFDLATFFSQDLVFRDGEVGEEKISYFPVQVDSGVLIIHPQQKCVPKDRDPNYTLWRTASVWGIVNLTMWPIVLLGDYWDSSQHCAKLRIFDPKDKTRGQVILYPEKWLDQLSPWLQKRGNWVLDRRISLGVATSQGKVPSSSSLSAYVCCKCKEERGAGGFVKAQLKKTPGSRRCKLCPS